MFLRYEGEAWERRFLPRLTRKEIRELPKEKALVVLPVGAVEQHGDHLPVMTDSLIGEATLTMALEKLEGDPQVWLIPPLSYGKSDEHLGIPGTISLSAATLSAVIMEIAESLAASGFRRLLLFNTHGGNADLLNVVARDVRIRTGLMVFVMMPSSLKAAEDLLTEREKLYGIHGGTYETSVVLAIKPGWVREEERPSAFPRVEHLKFLTVESAIRFAWVMDDLSEAGITGDASLASKEKGELIQERVTALLAKALAEMCEFEIADVRAEGAEAGAGTPAR